MYALLSVGFYHSPVLQSSLSSLYSGEQCGPGLVFLGKETTAQHQKHLTVRRIRERFLLWCILDEGVDHNANVLELLYTSGAGGRGGGTIVTLLVRRTGLLVYVSFGGDGRRIMRRFSGRSSATLGTSADGFGPILGTSADGLHLLCTADSAFRVYFAIPVVPEVGCASDIDWCRCLDEDHAQTCIVRGGSGRVGHRVRVEDRAVLRTRMLGRVDGGGGTGMYQIPKLYKDCK